VYNLTDFLESHPRRGRSYPGKSWYENEINIVRIKEVGRKDEGGGGGRGEEEERPLSDHLSEVFERICLLIVYFLLSLPSPIFLLGKDATKVFEVIHPKDIVNTLPKGMYLGDLDLATIGLVKEEEEKKEKKEVVSPDAIPPVERISFSLFPSFLPLSSFFRAYLLKFHINYVLLFHLRSFFIIFSYNF
jgi:hypothetical protein